MPATQEKLDTKLTERVLSKLGLSRYPAVDLPGLTQVYSAWCRRVPFDNIRKIIHIRAGNRDTLPGTEPAEFFESWLSYGTGGTCWSGNGALQALLSTLGFKASRGVGTMLVAPDVPPNHGTVTVSIDDNLYLVDASMLHSEPLLLQHASDTEIPDPAWRVKARPHDGRWIVSFRPAIRPQGLDCRIEKLETTPTEFAERHEQTRDWSPFNFQLSLRLIVDECSIGVALGEIAEIDRRGELRTTPADHQQRVSFLIDRIGIAEEMARRLPEDIPTPPPPGSATAQATQSS